MSMHKSNSDGTKHVLDDEGTVDQKAKSYILQARNRAYEREDDVYLGAPLEGLQIPPEKQNQIWGVAVRQYIRIVEPLLRSEEIPNSTHYYNEYEIADELIYPPDGEYNGVVYEWSKYYSDRLSGIDIANSHPRITHSFEPPDPKRVTIQGLKDVIETEQITLEWAIPVNPDDPPGAREVVFPSRTLTLKRDWLQDAMRATDQFLQEAGIGVELGHPEVDDQDLDPF